jgi:diguanylate cyclase (GGDEF)-like protein
MLDRNFEPELQEYTSVGEKLCVLVVDDSKIVRTAIRERLELGNLEVIEASSGDQALSLVEKQIPDIVLLDVVMPGLDGIAVLKILRNTYSKYQLPIIPVTCRDSTSEIVHALDYGANDYVTKPIDFDLLWARLSNQLMQKKAAEYLRFAQASLEHQIRQRTAELNSSNQKLKRVIQERLLAEDRLQRQANYDELTGLPNRSLARDRLGQTVAKAKRHNQSPCVAFLDLDNFKYVNDTLGHAAGDDLLREVARRLSACARQSDTVARLGGDEFLLILEHGDERSLDSRELDLQRVAERILESFARPIVLEGNEVNVSPSIGFAIYPRDGEDGDELMRHADAAMYRAKKEGKNTYRCYTPEMTAKAKKRMQVESQLRLALERKELFLHYQPIVDVYTGEIVKAEALLRWHNCELGMVSPDYFIKVAEDTGLIVPIGEWAIQAACDQLRVWRESGKKDICVTVNVSARQFQSSSEFCKTLKNALERNGLPIEALQLEITEGVLMQETPTTKETISELQKLGVKMMVDDFGTGYASLSCLQRYRLDSVKIDRSYIQKASDDAQAARLVKAIAAMASSLGISVVSEGVESRRHLDSLLGLNSSYAQGFYYSKPMPADEFEALISVSGTGYSGINPLEIVPVPAIADAAS